MIRWTDDELASLREAYANRSGPVDLVSIAAIVGRDKHNVCRKARQIGLTNQRRKKVEFRKPTRKYQTIQEAHAAIGLATSRRIAANGHPRGAKGLKHTAEALSLISARSKAA